MKSSIFFSIFLAVIMLSLPASAGTVGHVHGMHVSQIYTNSAGTKYYQDTMIGNTKPSGGWDGGKMDLAVMRGFFGFGNSVVSSDPYVEANLEDSGAAQFVTKGAFFTSNTVYALDQGVYPILNPVNDNGSDPTISGDINAYIDSAGLQKQQLAMPLEPGTNRFTILCPNAMELGDIGMIGLFIYGTNESPSFTDGDTPSLAAIDNNNPAQMDADGYQSCGYHSGDVGYFQPGNITLSGTSLQKEIGGYLVKVTHFNMIGRNDVAVNPNGLTSPSAPGYVCPYYYGQWGIKPEGNHAIAYLEIQVGNPPPEPYAPEPNVYLGPWRTNDTVKILNNGVGSFSYTTSADVPWLAVDPAYTSGVVTLEENIPFTVDRTGLSDGKHSGHINLDCGEYGVIQYTIGIAVAGGVVNIYGLHVTEINPRDNGQKYYQDTMYANPVPSVSFNANMDVGVLRGFYGFGNSDVINSDDYIKDNILDVGSTVYEDMGSWYGSNTVYRLDPEEYELLNAAQGTEAVVSGGMDEYINTAGIQKQELLMTLYPGVNRFTLLCPGAIEIGDAGMIGLYLFGAGEMPEFNEGVAPTLAAVDQNAGLTDGKGFIACGFHGGEAGYFQLATNFLGKTTLATQMNGYRVELSYFNVAGRNNTEVNPYGMASPNCVSYVSKYGYGQWAIVPAGDHAIAYLEVTVDNPPPEPALPVDRMNMGYWRTDGSFTVANNGSSNFTYTASSDSAWLTLDPATSNGTVYLEQDIAFSVDRGSLAEGTYTGSITIDCGTLGTLTFTVRLRVTTVTGAVNVYGLYLAQLKGPGSLTYYQDTMIDDIVPSAQFNACMDVTVLEGFYRFGNLSFTNEDSYAMRFLEDASDLSARYIERGYFLTNNFVYVLDPDFYSILNPVEETGSTSPGTNGRLADYIDDAGLEKQELLLSLKEGTNRFTLLSPASGEIDFDALVGLYLFENGSVPSFSTGEKPTVAAIDYDLGLDARGTNAVGFADGDAEYLQPSAGTFSQSTLAAQVGMYDVTVTYFNLADEDNPEVNPRGIAGPAAPGYVCDYTLEYPANMTQWAVRNGEGAAVAYLELVVEQIPEPGIIGIAGFLGLLVLRKRK
jgi:hypothetical protein